METCYEKIKCEAMVDIETLDTTDSAVIFQVAIVLFDHDHEVIHQVQMNLDIAEQLNHYRTISADTLKFHLDIPENLRESMDDPHIKDIDHLRAHLEKGFSKYDVEAWWSKGDFDFKLLTHLMVKCSIDDVKLPWKFSRLRELRTLMKECGIPKGLVSHNALEDCLGQIKQLEECRKRIHA